MGEKPAFRLIQKDDATDAKYQWKSIGAAWHRDDGKSYSLSIDMPDGTKMKCLMVENKPMKAKEEPKPETIDDTLKGDVIDF